MKTFKIKEVYSLDLDSKDLKDLKEIIKLNKPIYKQILEIDEEYYHSDLKEVIKIIKPICRDLIEFEEDISNAEEYNYVFMEGE